MDLKLKRLTEREKEVLRLLLRGCDVKTCARELGVTSNSVTERLRTARTKLVVTSSRHAARMLANAERTDPILYGDMFSAVEQDPINRPFSSLPDQAEVQSSIMDHRVREASLAFQLQPEFFVPSSSLPLRQPGDLRNSLSIRQRVYAIFDLTVKLSTVIALISVLALSLNMFLGAR